MPIYELTRDSLVKVDEASLASQGIRERDDLQRILRTQISAVFPDSYVLAEEFGEWEDSRRSIDLLCIDKKANLVVVELKRTEDGGHMELQAIRYAAMISKMTFADAVNAHQKFLSKIGRDSTEAQAEILKFLEWDEPQPGEFAKDVRIVLVSNDFKKEITTSVMWLNDYDIDIRCIRLHSYRLGDKTLLDIQQIIPLPEAAAYQVQLRKKAAEEREARTGGSDLSKYDLNVSGKVLPNLNKRQLFLASVKSVLSAGATVSELQKIFPPAKFLGVPGKLNADEFTEQVSKVRTPGGSTYDLGRYNTDDDDLLESEGKTWALSNQWAITRLPALDEMIRCYPQAGLSYKKITEETET